MNPDQLLRTTPPPITDMTAMTLPLLNSITTPEGLRIHIFHRPEMPLIYMSAIAEGGAAESRSAALASLAAIVAREGTENFTGTQIADTIESAGAVLRLVADTHFRTFSIFMLEKSVESVMPVFADIVCCPTYPERPTAIRVDASAAGFEVAFRSVGFLADCETERLMMGSDHPIAQVDTPDDIRAITAERLRRFASDYRSLEGLDIYLCGNVTDAVLQRVVAEFTSRMVGHISRSNALNVVGFNPAPPATRAVVEVADASQSAVSLTIPVPIDRNHPDYMPLHLTIYALGGYFGSRLMQSVREDKGLTYGIHAALLGYREGTYIGITSEADNRFVTPLIDQVCEELRLLADAPCCGDELNRLRQSALSSHSAILDSPVTILDQHALQMTAPLPAGYFNTKQKAISTLTPDVIATMARRYLNPAHLRIAIAGKTK